MKNKRITFVLDGDLYKKLRIIQAKEIPHSEKSISFSSVLNNQLKKVLK